MKKKFIVFIFLIYFINILFSNSVLAGDTLIDSGNVSIEEMRNKLKADMGSYSVKNFKVTHYSPLDSAIASDADDVKRLGPKLSKSKDYSPVQWYKENGKWVFSAATQYRSGIAFQKFGKTYMQGLTNRTVYIDDDNNKPVFEIVFPASASVSEADRKSVLPLGCEGRGMNYSGSPWSGSSGKIPKTGMIAAYPKELPQGTKLFIEGYGYGEVLDVGGAIKEGRLDLTVNNCELALKKGTQDVLVAFETAKALIKGDKLTDSGIDTLLASGVYDTEVLDVSDKEKNLDKEGKYIYESPFNAGDENINNIGVDDKTSNSQKVSSYVGNKYVTAVGLFLFKIAQVASIFMIGVMAIFWLLAFMAQSGIVIANEWLNKLSFGSLDVYDTGGFGKLSIFTGFTFFVVVIIMTGLLPKFFAFIYYYLGQLIEFLSRL